MMGDVNAKSLQWGSPTTDPRGEYLTDYIAMLDMIVQNTEESNLRQKRYKLVYRRNMYHEKKFKEHQKLDGHGRYRMLDRTPVHLL